MRWEGSSNDGADRDTLPGMRGYGEATEWIANRLRGLRRVQGINTEGEPA